MKRKDTALGGCVGENVVLESITKGDRLLKRNEVRSRVSNEDTRSCGSMVREDEVRSPWLLRDVAMSEENDVWSRGIDIGEYGEEPLWEGEESLAIVNGLAWLQVVISLRSFARDDERIWRNPLFEPPPFCICSQV
jgi:hypothetical protein